MENIGRKVSKEMVCEFLNEIIPVEGIAFSQLRIQYFEVNAKEKFDYELPFLNICVTPFNYYYKR